MLSILLFWLFNDNVSNKKLFLKRTQKSNYEIYVPERIKVREYKKQNWWKPKEATCFIPWAMPDFLVSISITLSGKTKSIPLSDLYSVLNFFANLLAISSCLDINYILINFYTRDL